jgi:glycosyltransferase involved in cell wall biosynthesis
MPAISVVIPCYNAARWVPATLASVESQRGVDCEVIIVDDGSTDGSAEVARQVCPDARIIRTENQGASAARNLGTAHVRGEFVQYLDADDLLAPDKLRVQTATLEHTGADVAYGDWQKLAGQQSGDFVEGEIIRRQLNDDPAIALFTNFWCPPAAYLFRRGIVDKVGSWNLRLPVIQDARFALDCALHQAKFVYCPGLMAYYRDHSGSSLSKRNNVAFIRDCLTNALEVKEYWESRGSLSGPQRNAVRDALHLVAMAACGNDPVTYQRACDVIREFTAGFTPGNNWISRMVFRLLPYRYAVACLHVGRSRGQFVRSLVPTLSR